MNFTELNMETWERGAIFRHFINDLRCVMSMTVEIDVTDFLQVIHKKGYQFYPAMIWTVSSAINSREELRMGYDENGKAGIWDYVSPYYAHFYKKEERFVKLVTEYHPDCRVFHQRYLDDMERFRDLRWFDLKELPPNLFDLSCLPWVHYQSFDMHIFDSGIYLAPVVTWGKYTRNAQGRMTMPLSMNIHHAAADGYHLSRFFSDVELWMERV